jgi:hypothetical protein
LGIIPKSNEFLTGAEEGEVLKAPAMRRLSLEFRWGELLLDKLKGTPWAPDGDTVQSTPIEIRIQPVGDGAIV